MNFVDTNVLVHATVSTSPEHEKAQTALIQLTVPDRVAISRQVMREYFCVVTRPQPWASPMPMQEALSNIDMFVRLFFVAEDGAKVWEQFRMLCGQFSFGGKQVHDANLVATMLAYGGKQLLTFNAKHFRRFSPLIEVVEP